jgi:peptidoglycan/LPS O-acetylase OafA/YrhL
MVDLLAPQRRDATRARLDVGDPLRALAALGVVAVHAVGLSIIASGNGVALDATPRAYFATLYGPLGQVFNGLLTSVSLFFVLSGYLLSRPFLRAYLAEAPRPSIPGYLRNRVLRVLPVFWLVLLVAVLVDGTGGDSWLHVLGLAAFVRDFRAAGLSPVMGQCWSLAIEVRFYLLLPVVALLLLPTKRLLAPRRRVALLFVLLGGLLVSSQVYAYLHPRSGSFPANMQFFAPGIMLAVLEHVDRSRLTEHRWAAPLAIATFTAGIATILLSRVVEFSLPRPLAGTVVALGMGAIFAGPLLWQWTGRRAWRVLDNRVLRWIGERSYPLFLIHGLVLHSLAPHLATTGYKTTLLVLGPAGLAASLACSDVVHRCVERPALRRKRAYAAGVPAPKASAELAQNLG